MSRSAGRAGLPLRTSWRPRSEPQAEPGSPTSHQLAATSRSACRAEPGFPLRTSYVYFAWVTPPRRCLHHHSAPFPSTAHQVHPMRSRSKWCEVGSAGAEMVRSRWGPPETAKAGVRLHRRPRSQISVSRRDGSFGTRGSETIADRTDRPYALRPRVPNDQQLSGPTVCLASVGVRRPPAGRTGRTPCAHGSQTISSWAGRPYVLRPGASDDTVMAQSDGTCDAHRSQTTSARADRPYASRPRVPNDRQLSGPTVCLASVGLRRHGHGAERRYV